MLPDRITAKSLAEMTKYLRLGDIVISPFPPNLKDEEEMRREFERLFVLGILPKQLSREWQQYLPEIEDRHIRYIFTKIAESYLAQKRAKRRDPSWFRKAPDRLKRVCSLEDIFWNIEPDSNPILRPLKFAGIHRALFQEEGLFYKADGRFRVFLHLLFRAQLANLTDPIKYAGTLKSDPLPFTHNRYDHTCFVYLILCLMLYNLRKHLSRYKRKHGRVAVVVHDRQTPAGGDGTKAIDPTAFDEELNVEELFQEYEWEILKRELGLSKQLIINAVRGKGILGVLLDIADKIAYVCRDTEELLARYIPGSLGRGAKGFAAIKAITDLHPDIGTLWDSVTIINDQVVFEDAERLYNFLKLRALLFKYLYNNPGARSLEAIISNCVTKYMLVEKELTPEKLNTMTDVHYHRLIEDFIGIRYAMGNPRNIGQFGYRTFLTAEEALQKESELLPDGKTITAIEVLSGKTNPATDFLVKTESGKIKPFNKAYPKKAKEIRQIISRRKNVFLFFAKNVKIKPEALETLKKFRIEERRNYEKK